MVFGSDGEAASLAAPTTVQFVAIIAVLSLLLAWVMTKLLSPNLQSSEAPRGKVVALRKQTTCQSHGRVQEAHHCLIVC